MSAENPSKKEVANLLRKVAKTIEERGHCKGVYSNYQGALCLLGAINMAEKGVEWGYAQTALGAKARQVLIREVGHIPSFNDKEETTKEDVLGLLRRTARALEHGGEL